MARLIQELQGPREELDSIRRKVVRASGHIADARAGRNNRGRALGHARSSLQAGARQARKLSEELAQLAEEVGEL